MMEAFPDAPGSQTPELVVSPGLQAGAAPGPAFELKFQLPAAAAAAVEAWARQHLTPDPHGAHGTYGVTSVYCDTPELDVFHRSPGYRRRKFRLRLYEAAAHVFLERKTRRKDRVKKRRTGVPAAEVQYLDGAAPPPPDWDGAWFFDRVQGRRLRPTCRVAYRRTAFFGRADGAPVRLTLDRDLVGTAADGWAVAPPAAGLPLFPDGALLELKYHTHLPALFHDLLGRLPIAAARVSKYRTCVRACGLAAHHG